MFCDGIYPGKNVTRPPQPRDVAVQTTGRRDCAFSLTSGRCEPGKPFAFCPFRAVAYALVPGSDESSSPVCKCAPSGHPQHRLRRDRVTNHRTSTSHNATIHTTNQAGGVGDFGLAGPICTSTWALWQDLPDRLMLGLPCPTLGGRGGGHATISKTCDAAPVIKGGRAPGWNSTCRRETFDGVGDLL